MRKDKQGNPDICRTVYTPVDEGARTLIEEFKLDMNQTIEDLVQLINLNRDPVVKRLLAMAISEFEVGAVLAAKAMTYETFVLPSKGNQPFEPGGSQ